MALRVQDVLENLPLEYKGDILSTLRKEFLALERTIVVLDDDPTGTQTCHDVSVLTHWTVDLLAAELKKKPSILFILTNSRSLPASGAIALATEIGANLKEAVRVSGRHIVPISRSDSTLRGHFPAEVDAVAIALGMEDAVRIIIPAFIEGGRYTVNDTHYIAEYGELVPVSHTPFAKDTAFRYTHSNLKDWVEEKTAGAVKAADVHSVTIDMIRLLGPEGVRDELLTCRPKGVCIVNACSYKDLEVVAMGVLLAGQSGRHFLSRTSATYVSIRAGIAPGYIVDPRKEGIQSKHGSLVVVGSYVPKTTSQLDYLLSRETHKSIEINVQDILGQGNESGHINRLGKQINTWLVAGMDVVVFTSRGLVTGSDAEISLAINQKVSAFLVALMKAVTVRPSFIIAKGGITSSDLASRGLGVEKALILGQAIAGVPVWKLDEHSKFPGLLYVVFPGNVGDAAALSLVCSRFIEARFS